MKRKLFDIGEHGPEEIRRALDMGWISSAGTVIVRGEARMSPEFERAFIAAYHVRCEYCRRLQLINNDGACIGCGAPL